MKSTLTFSNPNWTLSLAGHVLALKKFGESAKPGVTGRPDGDFNGISPAKMEKNWVFEQQKWWLNGINQRKWWLNGINQRKWWLNGIEQQKWWLNGIKQEKMSLNMISPAQNWVKHWDISWEYRGETWNALQGAPVCQLSWLIAHIIVPFMVDISN